MDAETTLHSPAIAQVMLNFAAGYGVEQSVCLRETGINPALFQDPDAVVTRAQEMRLLENMIAALPQVPAMGFELGSQYHVSNFGVLGFVLSTCRNLQETLELAIRYMPLSTAYCRISLVTSPDEIAGEFDPSGIPLALRQFLLERDMATTIYLAKQINLVAQPITRVELAGPPPAYADRIMELCDVPLEFGKGHNRIVISRANATAPLPTYNERVVRQMEEQCQALMQRRELVGLVSKVNAILLGKAGFLKSADEIAAELCMAPRTLRRKLEAEGSSMRALVDEARQGLAEQSLRYSNMKVEELAFLLGYSDAASFTRGFRRWYSLSPGEYRKQHQSG